MEFGRTPKILVAATVAALGAACTNVESHPNTGSGRVKIEAGTPVYDTDNGAEGACGEVATSVEVTSHHETYGGQAFGTWNRRLAFPNDNKTLPLEPGHSCQGDYLYVEGGRTSPIPSPVPAN